MPLGAIFRSLWILANILDPRTAYDGVAGVLAGDVHHFHNKQCSPPAIYGSSHSNQVSIDERIAVCSNSSSR